MKFKRVLSFVVALVLLCLVYVVDSNTDQSLATLTDHISNDPSPDSNNGAYLVAWSPNGKKFASASQQSLLIWDTDPFEVLVTIRLDSSYDMSWNPYSNRIATAYGQEGVRIWDTNSGELFRYD